MKMSAIYKQPRVQKGFS